MSRAMKDSGVVCIGEIPEGWSVIKLFRLRDEGHPYPIGDGDHGSIKPEHYIDTGIPYIRVQNLSWGQGLKLEDVVFISPEVNAANEKSILYPGDILVAKTGATIGKTAIIPADMPMANTTSSVGKVTISKKYSNRFYYYVLGSEVCFRQMWDKAAQKSAQPGFNIEDLVAFKVPFPSSDEQQRIAAFLDRRCAEIDRVIAATQRTIEEYKKLKQSIITEAVTHGVRGERKMKDSGVEWIGEIPEEWGVAGSRFVIDQIGDVDHYMPASMDQGYPYIMTGNLRDKLSRIDLAACKKITQADYEKLCSKITCSIGDVIYARYATIGTVCYVDVDIQCIVSYSCVIIKPRRNKMMGRFLYYYLQSSTFSEEVRQYIKSNTQENVGIEALYRTKIPVSSITEQTEIADYLDHRCAEIDRLIEAKQQLLTQLEAYKKSVIYEYVTGKREVPICQ